MAKKEGNNGSNRANANGVSSSVDELLLAAMERGDDSFQTGRYLVTYKEGSGEEALRSLQSNQGLRVADARDFTDQAATLESAGDADAVYLPEINVALIGGSAAQERGLGVQFEVATDSPIESVDPEYFVFADGGSNAGMVRNFAGRVGGAVSKDLRSFAGTAEGTSNGYLRGFLRAAQVIAQDLQRSSGSQQLETEVEVQGLGNTWGLVRCGVHLSPQSGTGIKVAVLGTGFDLNHPDFVGREIVSQTFVGQPVTDLNGHGTHMIGTACGPKEPPTTYRYGIGYHSPIFVGKVLTNWGSGTMGSVLAGMNWAIVNHCPVIFAAFGSPGGPHPVYTAAGQAALNNGCLIIAGSSSSGASVGAPANSPTIMSVAALKMGPGSGPASFSPIGKIDIAAPGESTLSSWPLPTRYKVISGLASAAAHVAGCAALWAETSPNLRGLTLWNKLLKTAGGMPYPKTQVGAGLVQAPQTL